MGQRGQDVRLRPPSPSRGSSATAFRQTSCLLLRGLCPPPFHRQFEEPCGQGRSNPEKGFSLILTQQSSRMIFPLASQAAFEPKPARRSPDPERNRTALLISQSGGGQKSVLDLLCQQGFKAQSLGRRRGGGSGGFTPWEGCHIGRRWWSFLASVLSRGTATSSRREWESSKTQGRRWQNHNQRLKITRIFSKSFFFFWKAANKCLHRASFVWPLNQTATSSIGWATPPGCPSQSLVVKPLVLPLFQWPRDLALLCFHFYFHCREKGWSGGRKAKQTYSMFLKPMCRNGQATGGFWRLIQHAELSIYDGPGPCLQGSYCWTKQVLHGNLSSATGVRWEGQWEAFMRSHGPPWGHPETIECKSWISR